MTVNTTEPGYSAVGRDEDPEASLDRDQQFPSSFHRQDRSTAPTRRHILGCGTATLLSVAASFLLVASLFSLEFSYLHGHLGQWGLSEALRRAPARMQSERLTEAFEAMRKSGRRLRVSQWNVGVWYDNPFGYWMSRRDKHGYDLLMVNIEQLINNPMRKDVPISDVFTDEMFDTLEKRMTKVGWEGVDSVRELWDTDFKERKIITEFLKGDPRTKYFVLKADGATSAIKVVDSDEPMSQIHRPAITTNYNPYAADKDLMLEDDKFWGAWDEYMFEREARIRPAINGDEVQTLAPYQLMRPMEKADYPDITAEEIRISLPLQTLYLAVWDAANRRIMNDCGESTARQGMPYQGMKHQIIQMLGELKVPNTLIYIDEIYGPESDVMTFQRVSAEFIEQAKAYANITANFHIVTPAKGAMDNTIRDENSIIFLRKEVFPGGPSSDVTSLAIDEFKAHSGGNEIANGDLLVVTATDVDGVPYVIASYRSPNVDGLASNFAVHAILNAVAADPSTADNAVVIGLDANTYATPKNPKTGLERQDVAGFAKHVTSHGLTTCWGDHPDPTRNVTTYKSKSFLQPELDLANSSLNKTRHADINLKDYVLFWKDDFEVVETIKCNTGQHRYIHNYPFPTLSFPSDHAVVSTVLVPRSPDQATERG